MSTRVTFHFPTDTDVRYLDSLPTRGDIAHGLGHRRFVVSQVTNDPADGHIATCVTPLAYARDARTLARASRVLAMDMRERAVAAKRQAHEVIEKLRTR